MHSKGGYSLSKRAPKGEHKQIRTLPCLLDVHCPTHFYLIWIHPNNVILHLHAIHMKIIK